MRGAILGEGIVVIKIGDVLKRAWDIAWRYKILWLFGFFAAEASGGGFNSNFNSSSTSNATSRASAAQFLQALERWWPVIVGMIVFFVLVGIAIWIVSVAARGGIVRLTSDADAGLEVRASNGWSTGFSKWGRVFLQQLVFFLPIFLIVLIFVLLFALTLGGSIAGIVAGSRGTGNPGALAGGIVGLVAGHAASSSCSSCCSSRSLCCTSCGYRCRCATRSCSIGPRSRPWATAGTCSGRASATWRSRASCCGPSAWCTAWRSSCSRCSWCCRGSDCSSCASYMIGALLFLVFAVAAIALGAAFNAFYSSAWTVAFRRITGLAVEPAAAGVPDSGAAPGYEYLPPPPPPAPAAAPQPPAAEAPPEPVTKEDLGEGLESSIATQPAGDIEEPSDESQD